MLKDLRCLCLVVFACLFSGNVPAQSAVLPDDDFIKNLGNHCEQFTISNCPTECSLRPNDQGTSSCQTIYEAYEEITSGDTTIKKPEPKITVVPQLEAAGLLL